MRILGCISVAYRPSFDSVWKRVKLLAENDDLFAAGYRLGGTKHDFGIDTTLGGRPS